MSKSESSAEADGDLLTGLRDLPSTKPYSELLIGSDACARCHPDQYASYQKTPHSQALSIVDPDSEPADTEFLHGPSKRRYRVYREGGQLRHRESLSLSESEVIVDDFPLKYLVGSGHHSRTYLVEVDGFLMESPVTWYQSRREWALSPGYHHAFHEGFSRPVDAGCLHCHAGHFETVSGSQYRLKFHELAISCERCHGPGKDHADRHVSRKVPEEASDKSAPDPSIVHPGRLSRELAESICSDCHLRGDATVPVRGHQLADFLPGLLLTDIRTDYHFEQDASEMKVVGHVDQMHASVCYQKTDSLTCTTCHDPHRAEPATRADYHQICLSCHTDAGCKLDFAERSLKAPGDDCLTCHMPQVGTDIPHIAFTHHRIGVHQPAAPSRPNVPTTLGSLRPVLQTSNLSEPLQRRSLGLAYLELFGKQPTPELNQASLQQARIFLEQSLAQDSFDAEVLAGLSRIRWFDSLSDAEALSRAALRDPSQLSPMARVNSLFILADASLAAGRPEQAREILTLLTTIRRNSEDWLMLADCHQALGDAEAARQALQQAARINPFREDLRSRLSPQPGSN